MGLGDHSVPKGFCHDMLHGFEWSLEPHRGRQLCYQRDSLAPGTLRKARVLALRAQGGVSIKSIY